MCSLCKTHIQKTYQPTTPRLPQAHILYIVTPLYFTLLGPPQSQNCRKWTVKLILPFFHCDIIAMDYSQSDHFKAGHFVKDQSLRPFYAPFLKTYVILSATYDLQSLKMFLWLIGCEAKILCHCQDHRCCPSFSSCQSLVACGNIHLFPQAPDRQLWAEKFRDV